MSTVYISDDAFTKLSLTFKLKKGIVPPNSISWAAQMGYTDLVRTLIDMNADVRENRNYPLELASRNGYTKIVRMLLDAGVRTSDSEPDEGYCLRLAAYRGHIDIVKMLLESGADPMAGNYHALRLALSMQHMEVVDMLIDYIYKARHSDI